jgi:hypothetical protein
MVGVFLPAWHPRPSQIPRNGASGGLVKARIHSLAVGCPFSPVLLAEVLMVSERAKEPAGAVTGSSTLNPEVFDRSSPLNEVEEESAYQLQKQPLAYEIWIAATWLL